MNSVMMRRTSILQSEFKVTEKQFNGKSFMFSLSVFVLILYFLNIYILHPSTRDNNKTIIITPCREKKLPSLGFRASTRLAQVLKTIVINVLYHILVASLALMALRAIRVRLATRIDEKLF